VVGRCLVRLILFSSSNVCCFVLFVGISFVLMFSSAVSVGIRLNCWKMNLNECR